MRKITAWLDHHLGYVLVIPALIFIILFSLWPVAQSTKYSFFDFQLNDQQKSGLYFSEQYNLKLMHETFDYIDYYLEIEKDTVSLGSTKEKISDTQQMILETYEEIQAMFPGKEGIVPINGEEHELLVKASDKVIASLNGLYQTDDTFDLREDIMLVASELDTSIIPANYTGLGNFQTVLKDPRIWQTIMVTLFFTLVSVGMEFVFGLILALIMNKAMVGRGWIRTFSLIPWAIPTAVAALMWAYLYNGSSGIVALILERVGIIGQSTDLMLTSTSALWSIIFADVWKTTPYFGLLLLAGLQVIPDSLYESAMLDGAGKWRQFMHITLPLLKPSILVALLFRTLDAFRIFDLIWVLTGGGPGGTTESISIYAYKVMFAQTRFGYGAAIILIMALCVGVISYLYIKFLDIQLISD
ncbi:carbohydrate ABC transporter permease [Geosporobacter ferrireducens]|uniref:ABC transporter permease n=1 Tax=Geosporobacter ferrireducens TaxID=1424294 RepID=A0A1D8GEG2_9FIRM|nr:sugar ABC transporter permease [Geosporobacter ferrireducens]AOT69302.1 ABC transporter permease [Geosporobacter ferrireducens]MTI56986.1 sugar ABC transporter permease [Geosporobacter ferrireducens]